jgi:hypothetical protein
LAFMKYIPAKMPNVCNKLYDNIKWDNHIPYTYSNMFIYGYLGLKYVINKLKTDQCVIIDLKRLYNHIDVINNK